MKTLTAIFLASLLCACFVAAAPGASILNQTTGESEARLVKTEGEPAEYGFRLTRCWAFIAGAAATNNTVAELMTNLNAVLTYTNPKANNKTYTGAFVSSKVWAEDENTQGTSDRHCTILQTLTLVRAVTVVSDLGAPVKDADQTVMNFGQFQEGAKYRVWQRYYNLNPANRAAIMALTPTESGYRLHKREFKTERDMTGTFVCEFLIDAWDNESGTTPNRVQTVSNLYDMANYSPKNDLPGLVRRQTLGADGLTSNAVTEIMGNIAAQSGWFVDNIAIAEKGNSEYGIRWDQTKARDTTQYVVTRFAAAYGNRPEVQQVTWYLLTSNDASLICADAYANRTNMTAATYTPALAGHVLQDVTSRPGPNGSYEVERATWKPTTAYYAWPESDSTHVITHTNLYFQTVGGFLQVRSVVTVQLTKQEPTHDEASDQIGVWTATAPYQTYKLQERGTGVETIGHGRYLAVALFISQWSGWSNSRAAGAPLAGP